MKNFNFLNISKIFFFLFILSLFFPIRYVFPTKLAFSTGIYSDFTSISLYLSDILLILSFIFVIVSREKTFFWSKIKDKGLKILIIWLILALFWQIYTGFTDLNAFFFIKMLELIVLYGTTAVLFQKFDLKKPFFVLFAALAGIQSVIALAQFCLQHPVGLSKLGEQIVLPQIIGIAKLVVDGTTYVRGYGTFPHPNPLSAFLVVGVFTTLYLFIQKTQRWERGLYAILMVINVLGLTTTFSRAAFLALFISLLVYFSSTFIMSRRQSANSKEDDPPKFRLVGTKEDGYLLFNTKHSKAPSPETQERQGIVRYPMAIATIVFSILISFFIFKPFLLTRATVSDSASLERMTYNKIGIRMIQSNPVFGVGGGESVLHMERFLPRTNFYETGGSDRQSLDEQPKASPETNSQKLVRGSDPTKLWPWQKQPIHNYFLLAAAELGIIGSLILIGVLLSHLFGILNLKILKLFRDWRSEIRNFQISLYRLTLFTVLSTFLVLMFFDHYFYTLEQTQMLLWLTLGLIATEIKTTSPSLERGRGEVEN